MTTTRVYRFGSPELDELHAKAWEPTVEAVMSGWVPGKVSHYVAGRIIRWEYDGYQYVVDHGSFRTLNTMRRGQHSIQMEDI